MMKKILVLGLVVALCAALTAPATAKKKKKGPKPYKSEEVTIAVGHPAFNGNSGTIVGVTGQEFIQTCAIPGSNGFDAYVFEVPKQYRTINSAISAKGSTTSPIEYDLDVYLFNDECEQIQALNNEGTDESGVLMKGGRYILIHNYEPGDLTASFTLKPTKLRF